MNIKKILADVYQKSFAEGVGKLVIEIADLEQILISHEEEWTSVEDGLPKNCKVYFVANRYGTVFVARFSLADNVFVHRSRKPLERITHWQSLPVLPKPQVKNTGTQNLKDMYGTEGNQTYLKKEYLNMGKYEITKEVLVEFLWELDTSKTSDKVLYHAVMWIIENWLDPQEKK